MASKIFKWIVNEEANRATCYLTRPTLHPIMKTAGGRSRPTHTTAALKTSGALECGYVDFNFRRGYRASAYIRSPSGSKSVSLGSITGKYCNLRDAQDAVQNAVFDRLNRK